MVWGWWPLRRHTAAERSGPPSPRARGRPLVSLRASSRRGARRQQAARRRGLHAGVEEQARAGRPPVGEQRDPSSRRRTHCGMEKRPAWSARISRGRTVRLSSPLSARLLRPRRWCSLGRCMDGGRDVGPRHELDPRVQLTSPVGLWEANVRGELFYSLRRGDLTSRSEYFKTRLS